MSLSSFNIFFMQIHDWLQSVIYLYEYSDMIYIRHKRTYLCKSYTLYTEADHIKNSMIISFMILYPILSDVQTNSFSFREKKSAPAALSYD